MGQIGSNNEPVREAGLYAWDGSQWIKVKVDTNGNLIVNIQDLETIISQSYGWVSSAWQKDPLRFGYSDIAVGNFSNTDLSAGNVNVDSGEVPSGEIWVITNMVIQYVGTSPTLIAMQIVYPDDTATIYSISTPTSLEYYDRQGFWIANPGSIVRGRVVGATLHDTLRQQFSGYRIDIDQ